jgi:hypothetical protein
MGGVHPIFAGTGKILSEVVSMVLEKQEGFPEGRRPPGLTIFQACEKIRDS